MANDGRVRDRGRRDTIGHYFYDLSKLTFAGVVVGNFMSSRELLSAASAGVFLFGITGTVVLAMLGNEILRK